MNKGQTLTAIFSAALAAVFCTVLGAAPRVVLSVALGLACTLFAASVDANQLSPAPIEITLNRAEQELTAINRLLKAQPRLTRAKVKSFQAGTNQKRLHQAAAWLESGQYAEAKREILLFQADSQHAGTLQHMKAFYYLGLCEEALGNDRQAARAYLDYLPLFHAHATSKGSFTSLSAANLSTQTIAYQGEEILEVLTRLNRLMFRSSTVTHQQKSVLMSSMRLLPLPPSSRHRGLLILAQTALAQRAYVLAEQWLKEVSTEAQAPLERAKAFYFLGRLARAQGQLATALDHYRQAANMAVAQQPHVQHAAWLELARLHTTQQRYQLAQAAYQRIPDDARLYPESLYEQMNLAVRQRSYEDAAKWASIYLERFPRQKRARGVARVQASLLLRSGQKLQAQKLLDTMQTDFERQLAWLETQLTKASAFSIEDVIQLYHATRTWFEPSPAMQRLQGQYLQVVQLQKTKESIDRELDELLLVPARLSAKTLSPAGHAQLEGLGELAGRIFRLGEQVLAVEVELFQAQLSQTEAKELAAGKRLRSYIFSAQHARKLMRKARLEQLDWMESSNQLARLYSDLHVEKARWHATNLSIERNSPVLSELAPRPAPTHKRALARPFQQAFLQAQESRGVLTQMRIEALSTFPERKRLTRQVRQYTESLYLDALMLNPARDKAARSHLLRFTGKQAQTFWQTWRSTALSLFAALEDLGQQYARRLTGLHQQSLDLKSQLETWQSQFMSYEVRWQKRIEGATRRLAEGYLAQLKQWLTLERQWSADLTWQQYLEAYQNRQMMIEKHASRQQDLRDQFDELDVLGTREDEP